MNLSAPELCSPVFAETRLRIAQDSGVSPSQLQFEIAEPLLHNLHESALTQLRELRQAGCWIAVDNLGRGGLSLRALGALPLDACKLDMSLLAALRSGDRAVRATTAGLMAFAQSLQLPVTLVGVETPADYQLCRENGVVGIQGYWLARPLQATEVPAALHASPRL